MNSATRLHKAIDVVYGHRRAWYFANARRNGVVVAWAGPCYNSIEAQTKLNEVLKHGDASCG